MTLDQLRIFLAVARTCHVTRAAQELRMTQSAVSAAIRALEDQHQVQLFDRIGRGIALTEGGQTFIAAARRVLGAAESAEGLLDDLNATPRGRLRVQASQTIATYLLPPLLVALRAEWPSLQVTLDAGNTASVAREVAEGHADLGFVEGEVRHDELRQQVFMRDELVLLMGADHPLRDKSQWDRDDYLAQTWVLREEGSGTRSEVELHLRDMGLTVADLQVALTLPSNEAVLSSLAGGHSVTMLSARVADLTGAGIHRRHVTWTRKPERAFSVLTHPDRHRSRAAQALMTKLGL